MHRDLSETKYNAGNLGGIFNFSQQKSLTRLRNTSQHKSLVETIKETKIIGLLTDQKKDVHICRNDVDQTISSISDQDKLVLLPTRDTNCEKRKKECKR